MQTLQSIRSGVLVALVLVSLGSQAAPFASVRAELSGFNIELIDLDPEDGITPSITVDGRTWSAHAYYLGQTPLDAWVFGAGNTQVQNSYGKAFGSTGAEYLWSHANILGTPPEGSLLHAFRSDTDYSTNFTLTPNTGLRLSASAQLSAARSAGTEVFGHASLLASWFGADAQTSGQDVTIRADGIRDFRLSAFLYTHDETARGSFQLRTVADTTILAQPASPVPEPSSYTLLLAGAAVLLAAQRRARSLPFTS